MGKGKRRRAAAKVSRAPRPLRWTDLLDGVPGRTRRRCGWPRPEDRHDLALLLALIGEQPEEEVFAGIDSGAAATLVLAALETDRDELLQQIRPMLATGRRLYNVVVGLMSMLVAEDAASEPVGACSPTHRWRYSRRSAEPGCLSQLVVTALAVAKIPGLAADERVRGHGVGSALLRHCTRIYLQLGYYDLWAAGDRPRPRVLLRQPRVHRGRSGHRIGGPVLPADHRQSVGPVLLLAPRLRDRERLVRARIAYDALVDRIRTDGWRVENYWFPLIADERRAASGRRLGESRARVRRLGMIGA